MSYDDRKQRYLAKFATLSPEEQRRHLSFALRWLIEILVAQAQAAPNALDVDVIDGEYTVGGEA
jgi:hypothetical protein